MNLLANNDVRIARQHIRSTPDLEAETTGISVQYTIVKSAGAVFATLMHCPQAPNLLDYPDEKGMLIHAEIPVRG